MWVTLVSSIVSSLLIIAAGIVGSAFTGGATGAAAVALSVANIMNIISGIITGATSIVTGALEIRNGVRALEQCKAACDRKGVTIVISGIHKQPYLLLKKTGLVDKIGRENIFGNINDALNRAKEL